MSESNNTGNVLQCPALDSEEGAGLSVPGSRPENPQDLVTLVLSRKDLHTLQQQIERSQRAALRRHKVQWALRLADLRDQLEPSSFPDRAEHVGRSKEGVPSLFCGCESGATQISLLEWECDDCGTVMKT